jgi:hypothetical protein
VKYLEKSNIDLLRELAEPYGIEIREVPPGEGGLIIGGKKLSPEEATEIIFSVFKEAKI